MAYRVAIECGSMRVLWLGRKRTIYLGNRGVLPGPSVSGWGLGFCEVEPSLIEDYLLNYSSAASV